MQRKFALGFLAAVACVGAQASVVFQDDFESGLVDWSASSNYDGDTGIALRSDFVHGGANALNTFLDHPLDAGAISNKYVRASHEFTVTDAGDYLLELWATNTSLGYEVLVDDLLVGTLQSSAVYEQVSHVLSGLSAGTHTLSLGLFVGTGTTGGLYTASFDDVSISSIGGGVVPEPQSLALVLAALAATAALRRRTV